MDVDMKDAKPKAAAGGALGALVGVAATVSAAGAGITKSSSSSSAAAAAGKDSKSSGNGKLDENLYSRQLYVFGHEAQKRLGESNVLILGLTGLGIEIAKNVILAGVKSVGLNDDGKAEIADLASQFYLKESDIGKPRAEQCVAQLAGLNEYVKVQVVPGRVDEKLIASGAFSVVVATDRTYSEQVALNDVCRKHGVKFIGADVRGVLTYTFVDLGPSFVVSDIDGEQPMRGLISAITTGAPGIVTVHEDTRHGLQTGQFVTFEEVEGMTELNESKPRPVKVINPYSFSIEDTTKYKPYSPGKGYFRQVKQPATVQFSPLSTLSAKPNMITDDTLVYHVLYRAIGAFRDKTGAYPRPDSKKDAEEVVAAAKALAASEFKAAREFKDGAVDDATALLWFKLARCSGAQISPLTSFAGGVVGQEVLKACSGKFTPIQQFYYFAAPEVLAAADSANGGADLSDYAPGTVSSTAAAAAHASSRYDHQIAVIGRAAHKKVTELRYFLVGAGAIGCEMLKIWALMGLGTAGKGQVYVTDMDMIEKSNLNRQFLFRPDDVGKLKSDMAAREAKKMNPAIRIEAQALRVGPQTEEVYDFKFWESLDGVCTALDNVDARLYVDQRCVYFQKPMIDSGTLGTKGNTQVVVPFLTESYGSSRDPVEESIPICTLKNFPNKIEHTIQWARDTFEGFFRQSAEKVNSYLTNPKFVEELKSQSNQLADLQTVRQFLVDSRPLTFEACIEWARAQFEEDYHNKILQLITSFPADALTKEGTKFWSGPKRAPEPIKFDANDELHLDYIIAASNLHAYNYGLKGVEESNRAYYISALKSIKVAQFVPKSDVKIATTDAEAKKEAEEKMQDVDFYDRLVNETVRVLPSPSKLAGYRMRPIEFEKDDDTNYHIAFIAACSNLRARNYKIKEANRHETKFIAGKIIPAIATTTALVTGLVCTELYKLAMSKPVTAYRNTYVNLALPLFTFSDPFAPNTTEVQLKTGPWKWSLWDRIDVNEGKDITLSQFLELFTAKYGLEVTMISVGSSMIYFNFGAGAKKAKERAKMPLSDIVKQVTKTDLPAKDNFLILTICVSNDAGDEVDIPYVRYRYRF